MKQITPYEVIDGQLKGARQVPSQILTSVPLVPKTNDCGS